MQYSEDSHIKKLFAYLKFKFHTVFIFAKLGNSNTDGL